MGVHYPSRLWRIPFCRYGSAALGTGCQPGEPGKLCLLQECLASPLAKLVIWAVVAGLIYHSVAGVKHLVADFGIGETMEGGILGARIVIALSVVLILLAGIWIW